MSFTVFVDGQEGTTGLKLHEYLAPRDDVELLGIAPERRKDPAARAELFNQADVAFRCLPDATARESAALVANDRWTEPDDFPDGLRQSPDPDPDELQMEIRA